MPRSTTALWILLGVLWLAALPLRPLFDPDEGRYAEIPREMVASGDWVTPTLNGFKYFEKPPLQYWATAALYSTFGVHEWTARLWSAALAFLCMPLVYAFMRRLGQGADTALIAAALLAINPYFALIGQLDLLDTGFTFFLSAALFSFVLAQRESRHWMLLCWASLALAVLSKGIVALVLAAGTLAAYAIWARDLRWRRRLQLTRGVPLFLLLTAPWFWLVQSRNPEFFQFFFIHEHLQRYLTQVHERVQPFWFFFPILLFALLPLIGNWRSWTLTRVERTGPPGEFRAELFLFLWCAVIAVFFSLSQSKLPTYVMPMMPPLAVLLAGVTQSHSRAFARAKWISIGLLTILCISVLGVRAWQSAALPAQSPGWAALLLCVGVGYLVLDQWRPSRVLSHRWIALAAVSIAGYQLLSLTFSEAVPWQSSRQLISTLAHRFPAGTPIYSVCQYRHSLAFYWQQPLRVYAYAGELEFGMRQARVDPLERGHREFLEHWRRETQALAFVDPSVYAELRAEGMAGPVVARDEWSIVVSRS